VGTSSIAAFFDFDGTLYDGHVWQDLARHHWATKRHRRWVATYVASNMAPWPLYKAGLLSQVRFYRTWGETMGWLVRGWTVEEGESLFERLTDEQVMPNLHDEVVDLVAQHQAQGHLVVLVSGLFAPWLEMVAQRLEIAHAIGTPLEVRDGRYTGRTVRPLCQGSGKLKRVDGYLVDHGLAVDWGLSFAYADSGPDVALLSRVGRPVVVFPDEVLAARAQAEGWPVLGEMPPEGKSSPERKMPRDARRGP
jgi:HAD superfamily hydrolase (TIGR01490 family)